MNSKLRTSYIKLIRSKFIVMTSIFIFLVNCQRQATSSSPNSIFGPINGSFYVESDKIDLPASDSVGILIAKIDSKVSYYCTATLISSNKILTNKHCYDARDRFSSIVPGVKNEFFFTTHFVAKQSDPSQMTFSVGTDGKLVANFNGDLAQKIDEGDLIAVDFTQPSYLSDDHLDAAVLTLKTKVSGELTQEITGNALKLMLISFPGGMPRFISTNCEVLSEEGDEIFHDCDSLPGSSGGLIVDAETLKPFALNKAGLQESWSQDDDGSFYQQMQRFRTREEAAATYCQAHPFLPKDCPEKMLKNAANRATKLKSLPIWSQTTNL